MKIIKKLEAQKAEDVKKAFIRFMKIYMAPAFGSISKRDLDISLFMELQELGLIDKNPEIYELVSDLRVTRAKARNLLYEAKLRSSSDEDLDLELKELLQKPLFLKDNEKVGIEIENPYLIDHLRYKLKKMNHITDGSFSPELVKLTTDAFIDLFKSYLPEKSEKKIIKALVDSGVVGDKSFAGVMTSIMKKLGSKVADKAGSEVAESIVDYLGPIINGNIKTIKDVIAPLYSEPDKKAK